MTDLRRFRPDISWSGYCWTGIVGTNIPILCIFYCDTCNVTVSRPYSLLMQANMAATSLLLIGRHMFNILNFPIGTGGLLGRVGFKPLVSHDHHSACGYDLAPGRYLQVRKLCSWPAEGGWFIQV